MAVTTVACIGAGYVGGPTMAVLALKCPHIQCVVLDINPAQIDRWNSDHLPVYEPGLHSIVSQCRNRNLFFSSDLQTHLSQAQLIFIAVNTPPKVSGLGAGSACDLSYFESAARAIASSMASDYSGVKVIVEKSTVPVRTAEFLREVIQANAPAGKKFDILSNPEFLAEGSAVENLLSPDRILIGGESEAAIEVLAGLYTNWVPRSRILTTNLYSSELSKLCCNAMLAQRISSINSLSAICEETGADVREVARVIGADSRLGEKYLKASVGFGGSCLAKDCLSLVYICESLNLPEVAAYWRQVILMNNFQRQRFSYRIIREMHHCLRGKSIAVLGFAYKKNTADTRETSAASVIRDLLLEGAIIKVFDPKVKREDMLAEMERRGMLQGVDAEQCLLTCVSADNAIKGSAALIVLTEWDEFLSLDFAWVYSSMEKPARIYDGRGLLPADQLRSLGFLVYTVGRASASS